MDDKNNTEREPRTEVERLLFKNERMQDALLSLKDTMSRMIGEGRQPNDDEEHQWIEGIDRKLEHEAADREVLLFNHGAMTTVLPKSTERYQPDLQVRYQEILTTCNKAYADADYKYWIGRFQQAGL